MRLLVLSDSHGDRRSVEYALRQHPEAQCMIHLGDGALDLMAFADRFPEKQFVYVRGNCDTLPDLNMSETISAGGKKVYITHGFYEMVKYGLDRLCYAAREQDASLALFGHTHTQLVDYCDGLYLFNPGSLKNGDFGIVDITSQGIICIPQKLNCK